MGYLLNAVRLTHSRIHAYPVIQKQKFI